MKLFITSLLLLISQVCIAEQACNTEQFMVEAFSHEEHLKLYMPVTVNYTVTNQGNDASVPIGIDLLGEYVLIFIRYEDGEYKRWFDSTTPSHDMPALRPQLFKSRDRFSGNATIYWQPQVSFFDKPGRWYIKIAWICAGKEINSNPVLINFVEPEGRDKVVLDILIEEDALMSLHPRFWGLKVYEDKIKHWMELKNHVYGRYPNSIYSNVLKNNILNTQIVTDNKTMRERKKKNEKVGSPASKK